MDWPPQSPEFKLCTALGLSHHLCKIMAQINTTLDGNKDFDIAKLIEMMPEVMYSVLVQVNVTVRHFFWTGSGFSASLASNSVSSIPE